MKLDFNFDDTLTAVRTILAWYWGDDNEGTVDDLLRSIKLSAKFVRGETESFNKDDFWLFFDALGSYHSRTDSLEELYQKAKQGWCE